MGKTAASAAVELVAMGITVEKFARKLKIDLKTAKQLWAGQITWTQEWFENVVQILNFNVNPDDMRLEG